MDMHIRFEVPLKNGATFGLLGIVGQSATLIAFEVPVEDVVKTEELLGHEFLRGVIVTVARNKPDSPATIIIRHDFEGKFSGRIITSVASRLQAVIDKANEIS